MTAGTFELDHLLVWVSPGAPEAERLIGFGLTEGTPNVHPGQGTANRRFFFRNAMLELIWVDDEAEARQEPAARLRVWERWQYRQTGASPFGLCLRRRPGAEGALPFETWSYRPAYVPAGSAIDIATTSALTEEPLVFSVTSGRRPDAEPAARKQPLAHVTGLHEVSAVRMIVAGAGPLSATLRAIEAMNVSTFGRGNEHRMDVGFDGERRAGSVDFRPDLPFVFSW